jgi:uncharacterized protein (TIGR02646 family)
VIRLPNKQLSGRARRILAGKQDKINAISDYAERVAKAKKMWSNETSNLTFAEVKEKLADMCAGAQRCAYCEDSCADEVEHIKPKDLYPEDAFVWENYLYACGPCNGPKNNRWAVFAAATDELTEIAREEDSAAEPEVGEPVFINPRHEDPLPFMALDLVDTFCFVPLADETSREYKRAEYTIRILRLNERDLLAEAREEAFRSYRARLFEYIAERNAGASQAELDDLIAALQRMGHPTVWQEMKRQYELNPRLKTLFDQAPEALLW